MIVAFGRGRTRTDGAPGYPATMARPGSRACGRRETDRPCPEAHAAATALDVSHGPCLGFCRCRRPELRPGRRPWWTLPRRPKTIEPTEFLMACKRPGVRVPLAPRFRSSEATYADLDRLLIVQEVVLSDELDDLMLPQVSAFLRYRPRIAAGASRFEGWSWSVVLALSCRRRPLRAWPSAALIRECPREHPRSAGTFGWRHGPPCLGYEAARCAAPGRAGVLARWLCR